MSQTAGLAVIAISIVVLALLGLAAMYYVPAALREDEHDEEDGTRDGTRPV